jgi:hypothetical protein
VRSTSFFDCMESPIQPKSEPGRSRRRNVLAPSATAIRLAPMD